MTSRIIDDTPGVFAQTFPVPDHAIDELGHVSNLKYLAWMQDIAIQHSAAQGWPVERYLENGAAWVVRSHFISYVRPAFAGETITLRTWGSRIPTTEFLAPVSGQANQRPASAR